MVVLEYLIMALLLINKGKIHIYKVYDLCQSYILLPTELLEELELSNSRDMYFDIHSFLLFF